MNSRDESDLLKRCSCCSVEIEKKVFKRRISRKMKGAADILIDLACIQLFSLYHDLDHKNSLDFTESMSRDLKKNRYQIVGYQTRQIQRIRTFYFNLCETRDSHEEKRAYAPYIVFSWDI